MSPEAQCRTRLALAPNDVGALRTLAVLLGQRAEFGETARLLERAIRLAPHDPRLHNDLGVTLEQAGNPCEAARCYRRALSLQPDAPHFWSNLGNALLRQGDADGALDACRRAIALQPDYVQAHVTLGGALVSAGRVEEALAAYQRAIGLCPDHIQAHANYGMALLLSGDFRNGWKEYEWRRRLPNPVFQRQGRAWDGSDPTGQTMLLYGEGGIGNVIQFARYAPDVARRGAKVIVECQPALAPLIATVPGVCDVITLGQAIPAHDAHCPLTSLPALLGTTLDSVPATIPYIHPDAQLIERWRPIVSQAPGRRVGICWKGSLPFDAPQSRSLDPSILRPLTEIPKISLISLQHGQDAPAGLLWHTLPGLGPNSMTLHDAAAVIHHLDLVISCDTSIAHLAGALGIPVWVALRQNADWRWMLHRLDSPWYPTMRLFREHRPGDTAGVIESMARHLRER